MTIEQATANPGEKRDVEIPEEEKCPLCKCTRAEALRIIAWAKGQRRGE